MDLPNCQRDPDVCTQKLRSERVGRCRDGHAIRLKTLPRRDEIARRGTRGLDVDIHLPDQVLDGRIQKLPVGFEVTIRQGFTGYFF
jgi:hypothetical protein